LLRDVEACREEIAKANKMTDVAKWLLVILVFSFPAFAQEPPSDLTLRAGYRLGVLQ
jgi:hypothetical protein